MLPVLLRRFLSRAASRLRARASVTARRDAVVSPQRPDRVRYEEFDGTWEDAIALTSGYNSDIILDRVIASTRIVIDGRAAHERDSVTFDRIEYAWPVLASLLWVAAQNGGRLRVLDLGGALGSSFLQNRKFLRRLHEVSWSIVEQSNFVDAGRLHHRADGLTFHHTIASAAENAPDVALLSSVIHYLPDPASALHEISRTSVRTLIIDRTPVHTGSTDRLTLQHVPESIYPASYPAWILSEAALLNRLGSAGWKVIEEFPTLERPSLTSAGLPVRWFGLLCTRDEDS